jgi:protein required for attachment to host cells
MDWSTDPANFGGPEEAHIIMMPITRQQVEILLDTPAQHDYVVSAYADMTVRDGFKRYLELSLKNQARSASAALAKATVRKDLDANINVIREEVQVKIGSTARGLAVFSSVARGLRHAIPLEFPVENQLIIDEEPFLLPLLERWYCDPTFLIALFDANEAHLFERHHGRPQPVRDLEREDVTQDIERDKPRFTFKKRFASARHERLHGNEDAPFLRELTDAIAERWKESDFAGLVLLGQPQHTAALRKILPKELDAIVVGEAPHAMTDSALDLNDAVSRLVDDWQAERQRRILAELAERQKQKHLVANGATEVLDALQQGRAAQIVFGGRRDMPGARCPDCGYRFGAPVEECLYCGARCQSINAAQDILRLAMRHRVPVMLLRVPAGDDPLDPARGVAALLRAGDNWAPRAKAAQKSKEHAEAV